MLREMADLGFEYVELSHGVRLSLIPGILRAVDEGMIRVASVHNFCPLPVGIMGAAPNLYEPSAVSRRERILWLTNSLRTVDFAHRLECDRVVLHSGRVRFLWGDPEGPVEKAFESAAGEQTEGLVTARTRGLKKLNRKKRAFMKRLKESFDLLGERARERGIRLGVENREGIAELPLDGDMATFLEGLPGDVFGYWHDTGHAQLKERMGLLEHRAFLESMRPRLIGFHLHDVSEDNRDHQIPGSGIIDWPMLAGLVREEDTVVMELSPRQQPDMVAGGREFLLNRIPALAAS